MSMVTEAPMPADSFGGMEALSAVRLPGLIFGQR